MYTFLDTIYIYTYIYIYRHVYLYIKKNCKCRFFGPMNSATKAYCGPDKAVTAADVRRIVSAKDSDSKMQEVEALILDVQDFLKNEHVDAEVIAVNSGMLQMDLVAIALNKTKKDVRRFETYRAAAHAVVTLLNEKLGSKMQSPWAPSTATPSTATSSSPTKGMMRQQSRAQALENICAYMYRKKRKKERKKARKKERKKNRKKNRKKGKKDRKSESERARERESERARERESERARELESEGARERESERARE